MKQRITEEMKIHEVWYKEAKDMTLEGLPEFINHLINDYEHDYGTICHAMTAGGIATMEAMNNSDQDGITGFQAGAIMWEFIRHWMYNDNKAGLKLVDYDKFLYPQYEYEFSKTINTSAWASIQKEALIKTKEAMEQHLKYLADVEQYNQDVIMFAEKHPDYFENPAKYEHLSFGNTSEWDEEHVKIEQGFEFAPTKPYDGHYGNLVYKHWQSIVEGVVPFGYMVVDDE